MTRVSISYGFGNENRYNLSTVPKNIQLALYKYELYSESKIKELLNKCGSSSFGYTQKRSR